MAQTPAARIIEKPTSEPEYSIGLNNDDGECNDIGIGRRGCPPALIATERS